MFNSDAGTSDQELADRFQICYLPDSDAFVHVAEAGTSPYIFMRDLLDTTKLLPLLQNFSPTQQKLIGQVTEQFKDYEFPVVTIKDRTNQEVCRIFQRINSSGTTLSTIELLSAWTWSDQFDLRNEIELLVQRLATKGFEDLDVNEVMRCLSAIVSNNVDSDALIDIAPDILVSAMAKLKEAMNAAIDFLEKDILIKNNVFLPFPIMIVPLSRFFSETLKPSANQLRSLRRWFWHCTFTQRYKAGTNRMVVEDLNKMVQLAKGNEPFMNLDAKLPHDLFIKTWRINSTLAKAAICLLAQKHPKSLLNGKSIDLGSALSAYNSREFHHIYPKAHLSTLGIQFHESNVIANICFLTASDNNTIGATSPAKYFDNVPEAFRDIVFDSALIPVDCRDGSKTYADFLKSRSSLLVREAERLIRDGA